MENEAQNQSGERTESPLSAHEALPAMKSANLPRLDWRTMVSNGADQLTAEDSAQLDAYFRQFVQLDFRDDAELECPCCHSKFGKDGITGWLMAGAEGYTTLKWGMAHGEAFCSKCKYPFRVYHRDIGPIKFLSVGLPYHPDELQGASDKSAKDYAQEFNQLIREGVWLYCESPLLGGAISTVTAFRSRKGVLFGRSARTGKWVPTTPARVKNPARDSEITTVS